MEWNKLGDIKLMVVDDDEFNRQLVMSLLSPIKTISFIEASDGVEALALLKQTEIDMVLLDLHMPNLNGYKTLEAIKKESNYDGVPVAILTTDEHEKTKLYALGADDFLSKPYKLSELESRIYTHMENRQQEKVKEPIVIQEQSINESVSKEFKIRYKQDTSTYKVDPIEQSQKEIFYNLLNLAIQDETQMNSIQVIARLSRTLAELIGYGKKISNDISAASVVRNIGLLTFSQTRPFLEYEFSSQNKILYKKYILSAYQLLDVSVETEFIQISKKVILQQREHFDGSGFPKQRHENQIHKVAYIVSLVETFDALLSQKNFNNKIYTPKETYDFLKAEGGQRFHPQITKIFLENFENFIELRNKIINKNINKETV